MRTLILLVISAAFGACSESGVRVRGTLGDGWTEDRLFISAPGRPEPLEIVDGSFELSGLPAGPIDLQIRTGARDVGRLTIHGLSAGATISLERIRLDEERDLAFPSAVRLQGADLVTINGLRMVNSEALPDRAEEAGVILALSEDADALLVRPDNEDLPDLPVVTTSATQVIIGAGAASLDRLRAGDSVRVEGRIDSGYLYARQITTAGGSIVGEDISPEERIRRAGGAGGGRGYEQVREEEEKLRDTQQETRQEARGNAERSRQQIPRGHRPPPGMCRDWDPNLPPGQQPPPRKC